MADRNVDMTNELLRGMRLSGIRYRRIEINPFSGVGIAQAAGRAQLLVVSKGSVLLKTSGKATWVLQGGDAVLMPHGADYVLLTSEGAPVIPADSMGSEQICSMVSSISAEEGNRDDLSIVFCGCMELELGCFQPLIKTMPEVLLASQLKQNWPEIQAILSAMERESTNRLAGYPSILARLADVVGSLIMRGWIQAGADNSSCLFQVLNDPRLSNAIYSMHKEPGANWTVDSLAREVGTSRSVFARRFNAATGTTPVRYLAELRMRLAVQYIHEEKMPVEPVAFSLGYGSTAAFTRAYKRIIGKTPRAQP